MFDPELGDPPAEPEPEPDGAVVLGLELVPEPGFALGEVLVVWASAVVLIKAAASPKATILIGVLDWLEQCRSNAIARPKFLPPARNRQIKTE